MASDMDTGKVSMTAIGEKLRETREKKNLTIEQAQKQTRIHSTVLRALEDGRCDEMLTSAYVKSFLKKYSGFLGLDVKDMVNKYTAMHPEPQIQTMGLEPKNVEFSSGSAKFFVAAVTIVALVVALSIVTFAGRKIADHFRKPKSDMAAGSSGARYAAASAKKLADKKGQRKTAEVSKKTAQGGQYAASETSASPAASARKPILNLVLKAKQPVLVQLRRDGELLFKRVLPKGTIELFSAYDSINIYAAKAEAIELILNGKPIELPTKGVLKDLQITRKGVRIK